MAADESARGLVDPPAQALCASQNFIDFELAGFLVHPEINVVILILAARLAEIGTHKVFAFLLKVTNRLVDLNEVKRQRLAGLVVLDIEVAIGVLMLGDVVMDRATPNQSEILRSDRRP